MNQSNLSAARTSRIASLVCALLLSQGCATLDEKFRGKEHEDIAPFAQKTVEVIVVENIQIRDNELVHLRRYVDDTFTELDRLQEHIARIDTYRDEIIAYSIDLVRVTELYETEAERVQAYADRIEQYVGPIALNRLGVSEDEWKQVVEGIRGQETLLGALRTFQPIINRAARDFEALIKSIETEMVAAVRHEFDRRIEAEFKEMNEFLLSQFTTRDELIAAMTAIDKYRRGDAQAIAAFRKRNTPVGKLFTSNRPSESQLTTIEADLRERIKHSTSLIAEMDKDFANYEKQRSELDKKEAEVYEALYVARLQIATWTRSHQALANGVKEPGEWMELSIKAAKLVGKAL